MSKATPALETRWASVPVMAPELRPTLVSLRADTQAALLRYMRRQGPAVAAWLAGRVTAYGEAHHYPAELAGTEELQQRIAATGALDLLVWQSARGGTREALTWFETTQAGMDACAASWPENRKEKVMQP